MDLLSLMNQSSDGTASLPAGKGTTAEASAEVDDFSVMVGLLTSPPTLRQTQQGAEAPVLTQPASWSTPDVTSPAPSVQDIANMSEETPPEVTIDAPMGQPAEPDASQTGNSGTPAVIRGEGVIEGPIIRQGIRERPARELAMTQQPDPVNESVSVVSDGPTRTVSQEKDQIVARTFEAASDARQKGADPAISSKPSPEARKEATENPTSREHTKTTASTDAAKKATSAGSGGALPKPAPPIALTEVSPKTVNELPDLQVPEPQVPRAQTSAEGAVPSRPVGSASPPTPPTVPSISGQIAATLSVSETGMAEIVLDPEELGKVRLTLTQTDGRTVLIVEAQRPETIDLMRRNLDGLTAEFADAGYASLSFDFRDNPQNWNDRDSGTMTAFEAEEPERSGVTNEKLTVLNVTDRLDLRL